MTKKSSDQDIELKSINSKNSIYENNPSEYDVDEEGNTKNLEHLLDKSDNENEATPFIANNNNEPLTNSDSKNRIRETDGNEAEYETLLDHTEPNLNNINHADVTTPESPNTLEQIENGENLPERGETLATRLINIAKSNIALLLSISALFVGILFAVFILPNSIFSIEYDKVSVLFFTMFLESLIKRRFF